MGWDAFAVNGKGKIIARKLKVFKDAANRVKEVADSVDGLLESAGLDCSNCAEVLEAVTGASCWDERGWPSEMVKTLSRGAVWPDVLDVKENDRWAVFSAKEFLETCAKNNYGVRFSW